MADKLDSIIEKRIIEKKSNSNNKKDNNSLNFKELSNEEIINKFKEKDDNYLKKNTEEKKEFKKEIKEDIKIEKDNTNNKNFNKNDKISTIKYIKESPRLKITILMIFIFISGLIFFLINDYERGSGTCPTVNLNDLRKISSIFFEKNHLFTYLEYDEVVASYFGKEDCIFIDKSTINKLRNI